MIEQLRQLFTTLTLGQRLVIAAVAIAVIAGGFGITRVEHERSMKPLYSGLAPEDASAVVQKLKESGVEHRVTDNGATILVSDEKIPELRLELAGAGVPRSGRIGYELFDKTNLGITDFTEHVNYHRAVEGELERSVKSLNQVEQARVHVTFPRDSVFVESREPAKASVLVRLRPGTHLTQQNVAAITNLVASAVEGLAPEAVSVLDMSGNLLSRPHHSSPEDAEADASLEYKERLEKQLMAKINATLEPLLGDGRFRSGVSVDCDFTSGEQSEESFDPQKSVMATSQRTEDLVGGAPQTGGVPGTASSLPQGPQHLSGSGSTTSRRTENITYQTSRVVRHVKLPQGLVKRVSASILLDQDWHWEGKGRQKARVFEPPTADKIKTIHDLVAGAIGLTPERGDQLIIESLPFETTMHPPVITDDKPLPPPSPVERLKTDHTYQIWAGTIVIAILIAPLILRRLLQPHKGTVVVSAAAALPAARGGVPAKAQPHAEVPEIDANRVIKEQLEAQQHQQQQLLAEMQEKLRTNTASTRQVEALKLHLKDTINKDPAFAANVLRGWLEEDAKA